MKGHMENGKFHPHTTYKGVRKSRDQTTKLVGKQISSGIRNKKEEMVPLGKEKEILIGTIQPVGNQNYFEIITFNLDLERGNFAMSSHSFDTRIISEDEGERQAKEAIEDSGMWEETVKRGRTEESKDDWIQGAIQADGWEAYAGELTYVGDGQYLDFVRAGQFGDEIKSNQYKDLRLSKSEYDIVIEAWKKLHLKKLTELNKSEEELMNQVRVIFAKQKEWDAEDDAKEFFK